MTRRSLTHCPSYKLNKLRRILPQATQFRVTFTFFSISFFLEKHLDTLSADSRFETFFTTKPVFVERQGCYSALLTFLVGWYPSAVGLPPGDIILAQLACPLNDINFFPTSGLYYKHTTIVNYASSIVNKLKALLTDGTRAVIYNRRVFTGQTTGITNPSLYKH